MPLRKPLAITVICAFLTNQGFCVEYTVHTDNEAAGPPYTASQLEEKQSQSDAETQKRNYLESLARQPDETAAPAEAPADEISADPVPAIAAAETADTGTGTVESTTSGFAAAAPIGMSVEPSAAPAIAETSTSPMPMATSTTQPITAETSSAAMLPAAIGPPSVTGTTYNFVPADNIPAASPEPAGAAAFSGDYAILPDDYDYGNSVWWTGVAGPPAPPLPLFPLNNFTGPFRVDDQRTPAGHGTVTVYDANDSFVACITYPFAIEQYTIRWRFAPEHSSGYVLVFPSDTHVGMWQYNFFSGPPTPGAHATSVLFSSGQPNVDWFHNPNGTPQGGGAQSSAAPSSAADDPTPAAAGATTSSGMPPSPSTGTSQATDAPTIPYNADGGETPSAAAPPEPIESPPAAGTAYNFMPADNAPAAPPEPAGAVAFSGDYAVPLGDYNLLHREFQPIITYSRGGCDYEDHRYPNGLVHHRKVTFLTDESPGCIYGAGSYNLIALSVRGSNRMLERRDAFNNLRERLVYRGETNEIISGSRFLYYYDPPSKTWRMFQSFIFRDGVWEDNTQLDLT